MFPISEQGPFYAALLTGGNLDTKGGPKTNVAGQVLDDQDKPIPGLYGVGNCVASASARAYWAGGATIGPILAFAYLAAAAAHKERKKRAELELQAARGDSAAAISGRRSMAVAKQTMTDEQRKSVVDRISQGVRQGGQDLGRRQHPGSVRRRRAGLFPEMGPCQRQGGDRADVRRRRRHAEVDHCITIRISTGSSPAAISWSCEGTSEGEHRDGPWRAGAPEHGAGRWCDVFEIRDWKIQRCFIYLDPDYAGKDTARYPWLKNK